jgi:hypothetical protein
VLDANASAREVVLDRIRIGSLETKTQNDVRFAQSEPGIAVDPVSRHAFIVGADFTVAAVDLDTLSVAYHPPSRRSLAKAISGPARSAAWLGNGMLAVGGVDFKGSEAPSPAGLRLVDTREWRFTLLDSSAAWFQVGAGALVTRNKAFGLDGAPLYGIKLADDEWLSVQGQYGYVCDTGVGRLRRVLALADGAVVRRAPGSSAPWCANLLYGQSAS